MDSEELVLDVMQRIFFINKKYNRNVEKISIENGRIFDHVINYEIITERYLSSKGCELLSDVTSMLIEYDFIVDDRVHKGTGVIQNYYDEYNRTHIIVNVLNIKGE